MAVYRFDCTLDVSLQNGKEVRLRKVVAAAAADSVQEAQGYVRSLATEMCHDAGSNWFDAPVEDVRVVASRRLV